MDDRDGAPMTAGEVFETYGMQVMLSWPLPCVTRHGFPSARALVIGFAAKLPPGSDGKAVDMLIKQDPTAIAPYVRALLDLGIELGMVRADDEDRARAWALSLVEEAHHPQRDSRAR